MKRILSALFLTLIAGVALAQQHIVPSTGFTRQLLRSEAASNFWATLGNAPTSQVSLTYSGQRPTVVCVATNSTAVRTPGQQGSTYDDAGDRYVFNTSTVISEAGTITNTIADAGLSTTLFNHWGDGDYYAGHLYVTIQSWNGACNNSSNAAVAVLDPATMTAVGLMFVTNEMSEVATVTVDPDTGQLYASSFCDDNHVFIYQLDGTGTNMTATGMLTLSSPATAIQGSEFVNGLLYLSSGGSPFGQIHVVDPTTGSDRRAFYTVFASGEHEGIAYNPSTSRLEWNIFATEVLDFDISGTETAFSVDAAGNVTAVSDIPAERKLNLSHFSGIWSGLLVSYSFSAGSGILVEDESPNGYDAALGDTNAWTTDGLLGYGLNVEHGGSSTKCGTEVREIAGGQSALSVSCWINSTNWTGANQTFVGAHSSGSVGEFVLGAISKTNIVQWFIINASASRKTVLATNSTSLFDGAWHHVVGTYDGATMSVFIDGSLINTTSQSGLVQSAGNKIFVGDYGGGDPLLGRIDEVHLWGRSLRTNEVSYLFTTEGAGL